MFKGLEQFKVQEILSDAFILEIAFINPLYTGGLFHCYDESIWMSPLLDESICHFRVVGSILALLFYF